MLVKFGESEFLDPFRKGGIIYMNTFEYYKNFEKNQEQGDHDENINFLGQADQCEFNFNGGYKLSKDNGFIDIKIDAPHLNNPYLTHLFCMSSIFKGDIISEDGKIFDERLLKKFGDSLIVIYEIPEFMKRLNSAIKKAFENNEFSYYKAKRVEYIDFNLYHGEIGPFKKKLYYAYQKEWRIGVCSNNNNEYILNIGSLEDISVQIFIKDFKNKITKKENGTFLFEF